MRDLSQGKERRMGVRTEAKRRSTAQECSGDERGSEVTNEVTEGGLKEIGRRWRGAKEAIAAEAGRERGANRAPPLPSSD